MPQGSFGEIRAFNDFTGSYEDVTWATNSVDLGGGWGVVSENEGTLNQIVALPRARPLSLVQGCQFHSLFLLAGFQNLPSGSVMSCTTP